jgi:hypothetical protein
MKLLAHFVAESANFGQDGTFTVFKGGITDINSPGFPTMGRIVVITRLEFSVVEAAQLHEMVVRLSLPGGKTAEAPRQPIAIRVDPTKPRSYANVITQLGIGIEQPGELVISASIDGEALPLLYLTAIRVPAI